MMSVGVLDATDLGNTEISEQSNLCGDNTRQNTMLAYAVYSAWTQRNASLGLG